MALPLGGTTVLGVLIERLKQAPGLDRIVLATTGHATDDVLADTARQSGIETFRGSEHDVLGRVCGALDATKADVCVEITGDCPLVDPAIVSAMIREFHVTRGVNAYVSNVSASRLGVPPGLDVQVFEADGLRAIERECRDADAREHVSLPFYRDESAGRWKPRMVEFFPDEICRQVWVSLDYREDYELISEIYSELSPRNPAFGAQSIIEASIARPKATAACLALRAK
jgi:spore coat polysaccharide biosynthesis protein SpsF